MFFKSEQKKQTRKGKDDLITVILFIAFIPGLFLIKTDLHMINLYKPSTEIRKNMAKIEAVTGGAIPIFIEFITQNDPLDPDVAKEVLALEEHLKLSDAVSKTLSVYDVFSTMNEVIYGSQKTEYPLNKAQINLMIALMQSNQPEQINNTLKRNEGIGRIVVFPKNLNNPTLSFIEETLEAYSSEMVQFKALGMPFIMKEMNDRIIPDQVSSILLAIGLVFILSPMHLDWLWGFHLCCFPPLQFHTYLSMLMWVTMIISSFVSLTFLPALLKKAFR